MFDRDTHNSYREALCKSYVLKKMDHLKSKNIEVITSIPCFEIRLMLHIDDKRRPYGEGVSGTSPGQQVVKELRKYPEFENYNKSNVDFFDAIKDKTDSAIMRAKRQVVQAQKEGTPLHHEDPSSRFYLIVETLRALRHQNASRNP